MTWLGMARQEVTVLIFLFTHFITEKISKMIISILEAVPRKKSILPVEVGRSDLGRARKSSK